MSRLTYVFVHGLSGWGSYDDAYRRIPYWGMRGGDLMVHLRDRGYDCYAASVAPDGSAWDRACELYAQIAGTKVDYGEAHSRLGRRLRWFRFASCKTLYGGLIEPHGPKNVYEDASSPSSATATSLTFVPVGPVMMSPPVFCSAWYASLSCSTASTVRPQARSSPSVSPSA